MLGICFCCPPIQVGRSFRSYSVSAYWTYELRWKAIFLNCCPPFRELHVKQLLHRLWFAEGFIRGTAGCVEHSFALFEALRESKQEFRQIVVSWLDLANAYGSVRHNLLQFDLLWYHVPLHVCRILFNYYDQLVARVSTPAWQTDTISFSIGLFQGCTASTILFDIVFNLLLDYIQPLRNNGYGFKGCDIVLHTLAYADDLTVLTSNTCNH